MLVHRYNNSPQLYYQLGHFTLHNVASYHDMAFLELKKEQSSYQQQKSSVYPQAI